MVIESERLKIYPLSNEQMKAVIENENDDVLKQAYSEMLQSCIDEPKNRIWYTLWNIELKTKPHAVVGNLCFKGIDSNGIVEIGYGLKEGYCKKGYMTEAVGKISEWVLTWDNVKRVESETESENLPSQRVLKNAGFIPTGTFGSEGPRFVYKAKNNL